MSDHCLFGTQPSPSPTSPCLFDSPFNFFILSRLRSLSILSAMPPLPSGNALPKNSPNLFTVSQGLSYTSSYLKNNTCSPCNTPTCGPSSARITLSQNFLKASCMGSALLSSPRPILSANCHVEMNVSMSTNSANLGAGNIRKLMTSPGLVVSSFVTPLSLVHHLTL